MNTGSFTLYMEDDYENGIDGTFGWSQTVNPDDTVTFTPDNTLRYGTSYWYGFTGQSVGGEGLVGGWYEVAFITEPSLGDATPPTVQSVLPYDGMTGVSTNPEIVCIFSEAMDPSTITDLTITLAGPGITDSADYDVDYDFEDGMVDIWKITQLDPSSPYTVTITTGVKDATGNSLASEYAWSFTTGASDSAPPTVTQTIPAGGDSNVGLWPVIYAVFSEEMDEDTLYAPGNITLYDNTVPGFVPIYVEDAWNDIVRFSPNTLLVDGHNYTATITTGVKDLGGNGLSSAYTWSFTVIPLGNNSDPVLFGGVSGDNHQGIRHSNGLTYVDLEINASDPDTGDETLNVTETTNGWIFSQPGGPGSQEYLYESQVGLAPGTHTLNFQILDNDVPANVVTFYRDIYIFNSFPTLTSPSDGASGVSTTPTFAWDNNGITGAIYYGLMVWDGPDPDTATVVWGGYQIVDGSTSYSLSIPADKALTPNTTYYWAVMCETWSENGVAYSNIQPFTTRVGTPLSDFDGDGETDIAIYRTASGVWWINPSGPGTAYPVGFGGDSSDIAVAGDYDADAKTDITIYRAASGVWWIYPSSTGTPYAVGFGGHSSDIPAPGDYDGDGEADIAIYRAASGVWWIRPSGTATPYAVGFGGHPSDMPVPGDYDGDGEADIAIYRAASGVWWIYPSTTGTPYAVGFGGHSSDIPASGGSTPLRRGRPMPWASVVIPPICLFRGITMGMARRISPSTGLQAVSGGSIPLRRGRRMPWASVVIPLICR